VEIPAYHMPVWNYRKPVIISNSSTDLTDYQVLVILNKADLISEGKMRSDCDDIRFTDSDGSTLLSYWIESGSNTSLTKIWAKVPEISATSTKTIYVYYGNPDATSLSKGDAVVEFFDDFNDRVINTNKCVIYASTGSITETNGYIEVYRNG